MEHLAEPPLDTVTSNAYRSPAHRLGGCWIINPMVFSPGDRQANLISPPGERGGGSELAECTAGTGGGRRGLDEEGH